MEANENLYEKIREILGGQPANLKVLEQQIDMDLQLAYFDHACRLREDLDEAWALEHLSCLQEPSYSKDLKRDILARCACIEDVDCYRAIERFLQEGEEELRDWACLALNESRMRLESKLLDESQVFISTGLGGKAEKLRYFVVLMSRANQDFSALHRRVISSEFETCLKQFDADIEQLEFSGPLASLLVLIPMTRPLDSVFKAAIDECNLYGGFLDDAFIVTNVRTLSFEEVREMLEKKARKD